MIYQDETIIKIKNYGTPISSLYFFIIESFLLGYLHFWKRLKIDNDLYCCLLIKLKNDELIRSFIPDIPIDNIEDYLMSVDLNSLPFADNLKPGDSFLVIQGNKIKIVPIFEEAPQPPQPITEGEIMRLMRENNFYPGFETQVWRWYGWKPNQLVFTPFRLEPGYQISQFVLPIDGAADNIWYLNGTDYNVLNVKIALFEDNNGIPDFSKKIESSNLTLNRARDANYHLLVWDLLSPLKDKKLVWIGCKVDNIITTFSHGNDSDYFNGGFDFLQTSNGNLTDSSIDFAPWSNNVMFYGYRNDENFSVDFQTSYPSLQKIDVYGQDDSPLMFFGKMNKVTT